MANSKLRSFPPKKKRQPNNRETTSSPEQSSLFSSQKPRLLMVWGFLCAGAIALGINLYRLQILNAPDLGGKAQQQQMVYLRPYIPRREIIDRTGKVLATDQLVYNLYAHPKLFTTSKEDVADKLAKILPNATPEGLMDKFNQKETGIRLSNSLSEDVADRILALSADGLELIRQYSRLYPHKEMASEVVGYTDLDHQGQAGIEYSQQKFLERSVRTLRLSRAGNGALMPSYVPEGFLHFDDLEMRLTIDLRLQRAARLALKQKMSQFNAKRGTVVVMDARDGSLLSLVCEPTYDPNKYYNFDVQLFKNWAVTDLYEPGSTFKPINVAVALEANAIEADSSFNDPGLIYVDTWPISNFDYESRGGRGYISVTEILRDSSNVGMVQIVRQMSPEAYYGALERLGMGEKVGIDLMGEAKGQLKNQKEFLSSPVEAATTSFGQGFSLTPIKLAQLNALLANGGKLVTPHVVRGLVDGEGQYHWRPRFEESRVFSPETSRDVLEMMETVVEEGTGKNAQIPGYRVAGKTGTAQKASPTGGYYANAKITSFVGIFPVDNPRYVVLAVVDEPQGDAFGSTVAAPVVKSVMEALISIENIPPSEVSE
ncbi:MAG: penicillin-binding protein 2 [Spirulinaceae cyanobacterium]